MDVHVPVAITEGVRRRKIDVITSQEDGTRQADDETLLQRATVLGRLLLSQDQDLLRIANEWQTSGRPFAGLVFTHQEGPSIGLCIDDIELIAQCYSVEEVANRVIYLPLR
jgi:predicted nuclease of predicted toxin-antitoxin system